jgi:uncharacterized protein with GYD domain
MPKYLYQVAYTPEAWATFAKSPQDRAEGVRGAIEKMGGKIESFYFAFGKYDVIATVDFPDNVTAAGFSISAAAGGALSAIRTTPLMTTAEAMQAMRKAGASTYKPPSSRAAPRAAARGRGRARRM